MRTPASSTADGNEIYVIANPGEGLTALAYTDPKTNAAEAEARLRRGRAPIRQAALEQLVFNVGYTLEPAVRQLLGTVAVGRERPHQPERRPRLFDYPAMMFDSTATPVFGPLATDRPNQFKTQFIYQFTFGTSFGMNEYVASGVPVSRELGILPTSNYPLQYEGRLSDGRTDMLSQTDLYVSHDLKFSGDKKLRLELTVTNLFNQQAAISKYTTYQKADGVNFSETDFYNHQLDFNQLIQEQAIPKIRGSC